MFKNNKNIFIKQSKMRILLNKYYFLIFYDITNVNIIINKNIILK